MKHKLSFAITFLSLLFTACNFSSNAPENYEEPGNEPGELFKDILSSDEWTVTNPAAITYENKIYTFDPKQSTGGFKRNIIVSNASLIKFAINTFIYENYDGTFQFLIDDIVKAEYTGMNNSWQNEVFEIEAGDHTIEWKRNDSNPDWLARWNNNPVTTFIKLKNFELKDFQPLTTINQTFESELDSDLWICNGLSATITEEGKRWPQSGDALVDTHEKILKLATIDGDDTNRKWGNSYLKIFKISVQEETALSFDYKCDLYKHIDNEKEYAQTFKVFLDDASEPVLLDKGTSNWKKGTVILSAGSHSVTFFANRDPEKGYWNSALTNSVYLDNITLAANSIASVDIYPKGLQETYVGGFPIQFNAKALRSDGSVISDKSIEWSVSGGSIDNNGKFTPGSSEGTISVTATIDGVSASNLNVKVHGTNYLTDSVTINGHTFTGEIKDGSGERQNTNKITFEDPTPAYQSFTTNGFFVIKGSAPNTKGISVFVRKQGPGALTEDNKYNSNYKYQAVYYIPAGNFEQRVWLRFGDGNYDVYIEEVTETNSCEDYNGYEGDVLGWQTSGEEGTWLYYNVTNKTDLNLSAEDYAALTPSAWCQCDDFLVSNPFNAVMAELPENASTGHKLQALYDWVIDICHYDYVSFNNGESTNKRKKQDAAHVVKYGMGVCEGYANLYVALARLAGVKSTYQGSTNLRHGWTECYYNGQWKMLDATWDDPSDESVTESIPNSGNYDYFLIDPNDVSHMKDGVSDKETDYSRTVGIK